MATPIHMIEFKTVEGHSCLQRADKIDTILESTVPGQGRGAPPRSVIYLLLANNNRVCVVGESRDSITRKITQCTGSAVVIVEREPDPEPAPEPEATAPA